MISKCVKFLFIKLIRTYQYFISPLLGSNCRFHPTCSCYCKECFEKHPLHIAIIKSLIRISKCHPFHPGGDDPS
ncbi:membrane protein insertion efficiency factor YidD [Bacteriovoracaceae bacterium]|nr:membrane protein insertion efficiency factor YidD [Bacteriovoracaceae bacterium]